MLHILSMGLHPSVSFVNGLHSIGLLSYEVAITPYIFIGTVHTVRIMTYGLILCFITDSLPSFFIGSKAFSIKSLGSSIKLLE